MSGIFLQPIGQAHTTQLNKSFHRHYSLNINLYPGLKRFSNMLVRHLIITEQAD